MDVAGVMAEAQINQHEPGLEFPEDGGRDGERLDAGVRVVVHVDQIDATVGGGDLIWMPHCW